MSEFINQIKASLTGMKKPDYPELTTFLDRGIPEYDRRPDLLEYRIGVSWNTLTYCREEELPVVLESTISHIQEAIYGDVRKKLHHLELAVYSRDFYKSQELLDEILDEMYK